MNSTLRELLVNSKCRTQVNYVVVFIVIIRQVLEWLYRESREIERSKNKYHKLCKLKNKERDRKREREIEIEEVEREIER